MSRPHSANSKAQNSCGAIVLCGGESKRMGFRKADLPFGDETFLERMIGIVKSVTSQVVVVEDWQSELKSSEFAADEIHFARDRAPNLGPAEGIRSGLETLAPACDFAFVTGCDTPLLKPALINQLISLLDDHEIVVPVAGGNIYGTTAVYRTQLAEPISLLIEKGNLRVQDFRNHFDALTVDVSEFTKVDPHLCSFTNINSPDDYFELLDRFDLGCSSEIREALLNH